MVEAQEATQVFAALDRVAIVGGDRRLDRPGADPLVVALGFDGNEAGIQSRRGTGSIRDPRYDGAGLAESVRFSFDGQLLQAERTLTVAYDVISDWSDLATETAPVAAKAGRQGDQRAGYRIAAIDTLAEQLGGASTLRGRPAPLVLALISSGISTTRMELISYAECRSLTQTMARRRHPA